MGKTTRLALVSMAILCNLCLSSSSALSDPGPPSFARQLHDCDPPVSNDAEKIRMWMKAVAPLLTNDRLGNLTPLSEGDVRLSTGAVLDKSCVQTGDPESAKERIDKFDRGLAVAVKQAYRCDRILGLPAVGQVIDILARVRIRCFANLTRGVMANAVFEDGDKFNTGYEKNYQFKAGLDRLPDGINEIAADAIHEALHSTRSNNRVWHATPFEDGRKISYLTMFDQTDERPCQERSFFEDRVYLIGAACFPNSPLGAFLYNSNGGVRCPGICEKALASGDDIPALTGPHGPLLVAKPLSQEEAKLTCQRIRNMRAVARNVNKGARELVERFENLGPMPEQARLSTRLNGIRDLDLAATKPDANLNAIRSKIGESASSILKDLDESCRSPSLSANRSLCDKAAATKAALQQAQSFVDGIIVINGSQDRLNLPRVGDIYDFYFNTDH